jgi:hypothetical protein
MPFGLSDLDSILFLWHKQSLEMFTQESLSLIIKNNADDHRNHDRLVRIATGCGMDDQGIGV